jgi:hypothetical protein
LERRIRLVLIVLAAVAAACSGPDPASLMRAVDGIEGWTRTGPPDRYAKDGLYGYIDGGAELVLEYGFRELSVFTFEAASSPAGEKELVLEIYRMESGPAAFGLYSSKLEGGEERAPGITADNWIGAGQGSLVKGDLLVNVVAPGLPGPEIAAVLGAVDRKLPSGRTVWPKGLERLPPAGMVPSSRRFIRGPVAAGNESPFLEGDFWSFRGAADGEPASEAVSARYGAAPAVFKLVVISLAPAVDAAAVDAGVKGLFSDYLGGVASSGGVLEGRNQADRRFLFGRAGRIAALVLGASDGDSARALLDRALGGPGSK